MITPEEAIIKVLRNKVDLPEIAISLNYFIDDVYDGNINAFLNNGFNCVKNGCLHIMWKDGYRIKKLSYDL